MQPCICYRQPEFTNRAVPPARERNAAQGHCVRGNRSKSPAQRQIEYRVDMLKSCLATVVLIAAACSHTVAPTGSTVDAPIIVDTAVTGCKLAKIAFTQAQGCANDGSVEFCIPNNASAVAAVTAIAADTSCAAGGGRAGCLATPNLLLCSKPTMFPAHCDATHGALSASTWATLCQIAELPMVTQIVATILE